MRWWISIFLLASACQAPPSQDGINDSFVVDGKADSTGISEGSPDALGVLALVNSADYATLHQKAGVAKRASHNIVAYRLGDDGVAGTADDQRFGSLKELDAIPYVGPVAFQKLLAYARAHGYVSAPQDLGAPPDLSPIEDLSPTQDLSPNADWQSDIPTGTTDVTVWMPATETYCQPTCIDYHQSVDLALTISRASTGAVAVGFSFGGDDYPAEAVNADGTFSRDVRYTNANGDGEIRYTGHFAPGRVVVIETYSWDYSYTHGMFAGWYSDVSNTAPGNASF